MAIRDDRTAAGTRALQDRLTRLSEASLRINEDLDYHAVLEEVTNSARTLTTARYGATTVLNDANRLEEFVTSGLTPEEHRQMEGLPESADFFRYLNGLPDPLRINDLASYLRSLGMAEWESARGRRFPAGRSHPQQGRAAGFHLRGERRGGQRVHPRG